MVYSLIKAVIFAIVVTMIHCYYGYNASGGPAGVGTASGQGHPGIDREPWWSSTCSCPSSCGAGATP